uniref:Uncharacterized protein n=1 Tax=Cannabis sativa TaxID=3483 RepID=A0A803PVH9_CANSA
MPKILALEEADKYKEAPQQMEADDPRTTIPVGENMDDLALLASNVPLLINSAIPEVLSSVPTKDPQLPKDLAQP